VKLAGVPYLGPKRTQLFCFQEKIKNKKVFFPGSLVPSRAVHKVPPVHFIPSRNVQSMPVVQCAAVLSCWTAQYRTICRFFVVDEKLRTVIWPEQAG
jgi:hypothetical protein